MACCLCLQRTGMPGSCHACLSFMWVVEIKTPVHLLLAGNAFPTEPFPQPTSLDSTNITVLDIKSSVIEEIAP